MTDTYDYEYADCVAKQTDFDIVEEFVWKQYNQWFTIILKKHIMDLIKVIGIM